MHAWAVGTGVKLGDLAWIFCSWALRITINFGMQDARDEHSRFFRAIAGIHADSEYICTQARMTGKGKRETISQRVCTSREEKGRRMMLLHSN